MRVMTAVTCCDDCPLCQDFARCVHPQRPSNKAPWDDDNDPTETAPVWCPLREGELLITLRVKS